MLEDILHFARTVGRVEAGEEETLASLCQAAQEELEGRLRPDVTAEECRGALVIAAAWIALAGLWVSRQGGEEDITAWSAGDVSVSGRRSAGERAAVYRAQAERLMAPYVADGGFAFLGVRG